MINVNDACAKLVVIPGNISLALVYAADIVLLDTGFNAMLFPWTLEPVLVTVELRDSTRVALGTEVYFME